MTETNVPIAMAVHGGAWNLPDEAVAASLAGVRLALDDAWGRLRAGAAALDAVQAAVEILEDDPVFDAGRGSHFNALGEVEMDASVMRGCDLGFGAVAAITRVRHPVAVARAVLDRSPHALLVGDGAGRFADACDIARCDTEELLVGRELDRWRRVRAGETDLVDLEFSPDGLPPTGTVGAVAVDRDGRLAAATSTGGTQNKAAGRVGDSPLPGCGTYAERGIGAASATGWGEALLRVGLTRTAIESLRAGADVETAAAGALDRLESVGGRGGLILVDAAGRPHAAFNTPRMARGVATLEHGPRCAVERGEPS